MDTPLPDSDAWPHRRPPHGGEPLIPILAVDEALRDPVALDTWHEALSDALRPDVPHDLLALWLFPSAGGAVLLGPAALAADRLSVPMPAPVIDRGELDALEEVIRHAGYGSVAALPIRVGRRDVALVLAADLRPDRWGAAEHAMLRIATHRLAPMLGRLARLWPTAAFTPEAAVMADADHLTAARLLTLIDALGSTNRETSEPRAFAAALSRALESMLPHDHLELLIGGPDAQRWLRLGEQVGPRLWTDPALIIERPMLNVDALFEGNPAGPDRLLLPDTYADARWPRGFLTAANPPGAELRGVVGVRVTIGQGSTAYLILGSIGAEFYREEDVRLLARVAALMQPRLESFVRAAPPPPVAPRERIAGRHPLAAVADHLATVADPAEALRLAADEAKLLLSFHKVWYVLRLTDGDRVVIVEPGERRPLPDLPLVPIADALFADVLSGSMPYMSQTRHGESQLAVPLRVGGRVHGVVVLTSARAEAFDTASITLAQRFADLVAPHFELLRRAALLPSPYSPGWKRSGR